MKIVRESITDVLQPKPETEVLDEMSPLIDHFVNSISPHDFEEAIEATYMSGQIRRFNERGKVSYLMNHETLFDVVDHLASMLSVGKDPETDDYYHKHEKFSDFWVNLHMNNNDIPKESYILLVDNILEKFANKFNIEY